MTYTVEQVMALAPDESSAKAARGLLSPGKWPTLGFNEAAIWGECQGSGSRPYQTQIDLSGPAFRCSCPSRKFPCKHGLALFLLQVQQVAAFSAGAEPPAWVSEWLSSRQAREEKREAKAAAVATEAAADPVAAARREARRQDRVDGGVEELSLWLADQVRHGLAAFAEAAPANLPHLAARMVDAQAGGLAARIEATPLGVGSEWPGQVLAHFGRLQLLVDAWRRLDHLPEPVQADVRQAVGMSLSREVVLAGNDNVADTWSVLGVILEENGRLWTRRAWLYGHQSGRHAMLLDHAHGTPRFPEQWVVGTSCRATLAFFPGAQSLRALVTEVARSDDVLPAVIFLAPEAALDVHASRLAAAPWGGIAPMALAGMRVCRINEDWWLANDSGDALLLRLGVEEGWRLLAQAGGHPADLFGEWDGERLRPLATWQAGRLGWYAGARL